MLNRGTSRLKAFGAAGASMGAVRLFYRCITAPQVAVLVVLCAAAGLSGANLFLLSGHLTAVIYLVVFNAVLLSRRSYYSARTLRVHLSGMAALLCVAALFGRLEPMSAVYIPMALIYLSLVLQPAVWRAALYVGLPPLLFLGAFWSINAWDTGLWGDAAWRGLAIVWSAFGVWVLRTLIMPSVPSVRESEPAIRLSSAAYQAAAGGLVAESEPEAAHRAGIMALSERELLTELAGSISRRLLGGCFLIGALVFAAAAVYRVKTTGFVAGWVLLVLLQAFLAALLPRQSARRRFHVLALVGALSGLGWWILAACFPLDELPLDTLVLGTVIAMYGGFPLNWRGSLAFSFAAGAAIIWHGATAGEWVVCGLLLLLAVIKLRGAWMEYMLAAARAVNLANAQVWQWETPTMAGLRSLAAQLGLILQSRRVLIVVGQNRCEVAAGDLVLQMDGSGIYVRGLVQLIDSSAADHGLLHRAQLGDQFVAPLHDWFGGVPPGLFFIRLRVVVDKKEEWAAVFVPAGVRAWLCGVERVFRTLVGASAQARSALEVARLRFVSSGMLLNTQRSASESELEMNQVVHFVNNLSQDIAIQCDNLRSELTAEDAERLAGEKALRLRGQVDQIELYARMLAARVTDVKLVKELLQLKGCPRLEEVEVGPILNELELCGRERALRREEEFSLVGETAAAAGVVAASREFLETALRSVLQVASSRAKRPGKVSLHVAAEGAQMVFRIGDNGAPLDPGLQERILAEDGDYGTENWSLDCLRAMANLARLSGGECRFLAPQGELQNLMELRLRACRVSSEAESVTAGHWALLVDDSAEVTTFYARAARALNMPYFTAASLAEAKRIIDTQGRPRLVITDIHLQDGSGLALLQIIREQFGAELPVIVVSGEAGEEVREQARAAGASKFLTKPVNRRKLFAEIRETVGLET